MGYVEESFRPNICCMQGKLKICVKGGSRFEGLGEHAQKLFVENVKLPQLYFDIRE